MEAFAEVVRRGLVDTFICLDNDWVSVGHLAGTTVTAVVVIGYLLTVANVGDSGAVLDTGCSILELTGSHRIHTNTQEQARLKGAGCTLAPLGFHLQGPAKQGELGVGPLRLWPGGLCVSRSIGDLDAGPEVVPMPHVKQVVLPSAGARLTVCSDGVWDLMSYSKAVKMSRMKTINTATGALMSAVSRDLRMMDDVTIIIVDFLPSENTSFPTIALKGNPQGEKQGGLFACFKPELDEPDSRSTAGAGRLTCLADNDSLLEFPLERQRLLRATLVPMSAMAVAQANKLGTPLDFTMHGASRVQLYQGASGAAEVTMDLHHQGHPGHPSLQSSPSCDSPSVRSAGNNDFDTPVIAFGSAPGDPTAALRGMVSN